MNDYAEMRQALSENAKKLAQRDRDLRSLGPELVSRVSALLNAPESYIQFGYSDVATPFSENDMKIEGSAATFTVRAFFPLDNDDRLELPVGIQSKLVNDYFDVRVSGYSEVRMMYQPDFDMATLDVIAEHVCAALRAKVHGILVKNK